MDVLEPLTLTEVTYRFGVTVRVRVRVRCLLPLVRVTLSFMPES